MRLFPAHIHDAKEMARSLCDCLTSIGLTTNCTDPDAISPSLQQTQELMAKAMGYSSWRELSILLVQAHEPVYLDSVDKADYSRLFDELGTRLSAALGYDYAHGFVFNAIGNSGVGFSPKARRAMGDNSSPWGPIDEEVEIAPGIRFISTASHGGLLLSEIRQQNMPEHLRLEGAGYEEDGEFYLVALGFPEEANSMGISLRSALVYFGLVDHSAEHVTHSELVSAMFNSGKDLRTLDIPELVEPQLTEIEEKIIKYLARCVHLNRLPLRFPGREDPFELERDLSAKLDSFTLKEWVKLFDTIPTVEGHWAMRDGPWYRHWAWQSLDGERQEAYRLLMDEASAKSRSKGPAGTERDV